MRMRGGLASAAGLALVLATLSASVASPSPRCPDPRTCNHYDMNPGVWPASSDGVARIPYFINPTQSWLPEADAIAAIRAGLSTWERWNPKVRFVYGGVTTTPPLSFDGLNVIGWPAAKTEAGTHRSGSRIDEFDIFLDLAGPWTWNPCAQQDGSCTTVPWYGPGELVGQPDGFIDLQAIVTHEAGHALGLGDLGPGDDCLLTMRGGVGASADQQPAGCNQWTNRSQATLGLGDVLGLKKLYPWTCPKIKPGRPYPSAYRYLCPKIKIFVP